MLDKQVNREKFRRVIPFNWGTLRKKVKQNFKKATPTCKILTQEGTVFEVIISATSSLEQF